MRLIKQL